MKNKNVDLFFKQTFIICLFFLLVKFSYAQKQETRDVKTFSKIYVNDRIIAILVEDTISKIFLNPEAGAWNEECQTKSDGKQLNISSEGKFRDSKMFCYVHYDQPIVYIDVDGGGIIRTDSNQVLETKKLEIKANIDGFTNLNVKVDELIISAGSGCDIYVKGFANKVTVYGTTGSKIHLEDLECMDAEVTSNMGAKVWLTAKKNYKAKAGSGGKIYYYAEPSGEFERSRITGGDILLITR
jgi:hypothetical protein